MENKFKILFVCLGDLCRAPAAQGIMQYLMSQYNLTDKIEVDACGTTDFNEGYLPDKRMRGEANKRGITLNHRARQITKKDLEYFDLIVPMDNYNFRDVMRLGGTKDKVIKMINFVSDKKGCKEIVDPYYEDVEEFNFALDLIFDGCNGILKKYNFI